MRKKVYRKIFSLAVCGILSVKLFAQLPTIKQWDYRFGGTRSELLTCFQKTSDAGYLLCGYSDSNMGGDISQINWDGTLNTSDFWIVKTDAIGNKVWDKRFGGSNEDKLYCSTQTTDGGYIFGGYTLSSDSDVSQPPKGSHDFWIVKTDASGNKLWDKRYGGSSEDDLYALKQTADGGYILAGVSYSNASGNKSENLKGLFDYWVIKTDAAGNKLWDKSFGGTLQNRLTSILTTNDGGYLLGGYSNSDAGADKTQPNWDTTLVSSDFWVVKTDASGNKQWDKRFGGTDYDRLFCMTKTIDGAYVLGGTSASGKTGDKTERTRGSWDYWIVKTDAYGNKLWDKRYGGTGREEDFNSLIQLSDYGFLLGGTSFSNASGEKSENNLGAEQSWIIRTDQSGEEIWDKTILTNGNDDNGFIVPIGEGCYTIANYSAAGASGFKSQPNWDVTNATEDYWMVQFCDLAHSTVSVESNEATPINMEVLPNPTFGKSILTVHSSTNDVLTVIVSDIIGREISRQNYNVAKGINTVAIDLAGKSDGVYFVSAKQNFVTATVKIIKR